MDSPARTPPTTRLLPRRGVRARRHGSAASADSPRGAGFTLIEVLVAVAIIAVLLGLLLPAVQKVREAAARTKCLNNLKQIALAAHAYHDARGKIPPGGHSTPPALNANPAPKCREAEWSWLFHILPFLEQDALHREPDANVIRTTPVKTYYCPSRRAVALYGNRAMTDYAGNAGTDWQGLDGVIRRTSFGKLKFSDITDGTSNTVFAGEKRLNKAMFGTAWDDDAGYALPGWNLNFETFRKAAHAPEPDFHSPGFVFPSYTFGSSHPGVFNAAFCDGAVRTIRYSVSLPTWQKACVRNDNAVFSPNDL
jgi:prepilin-type N-terminal cleavage/methylation domain-containing protein/prepilin-type processing-associated H-X9-DG protein